MAALMGISLRREHVGEASRARAFKLADTAPDDFEVSQGTLWLRRNTSGVYFTRVEQWVKQGTGAMPVPTKRGKAE